jgi:hypothetical protein
VSRNSSGTATPPAGQPPSAGAVISLADHNALVSDIYAELTDSLSRSGKGTLTAVLKAIDGALSAPGYTFGGEPTSGLSRAGAGDLRLSILGALVVKFLASGVEVTGTVKASDGLADDASHGVRGGGTQHAAATAGAAGFMPAADKALIDTATNAPTASALVKRDTAGRAQFDDPWGDSDAATKGYVDQFLVEPIASVTAAGGLVFGRGLTVSGSAGTYALTFTTARADTNYAVAASCLAGEVNVTSKTVNGFSVLTTDSSGSLAARDFDVIVRGLY